MSKVKNKIKTRKLSKRDSFVKKWIYNRIVIEKRLKMKWKQSCWDIKFGKYIVRRDILSDFTYDLLKKGLEVSSLRQKSVSTNIANINTENYKAKKVPFEEVLKGTLGDLNMRKTDNKHFGYNRISDFQVRQEERKNTYVNDNGNNVDIDLEMTEAAANELYYASAVRQVNSKLSRLNLVINR